MAQTGWTVSNIPPQTGRLAIVTGSTSGIGYESALALARAGARVIVSGRDAQRGERALAAIRKAHPSADVSFHALDTARLASVRAFAQHVATDQPIDILLLNAGIASVPKREETEDGFERQLATNYLGHFALAGLLLGRMRQDPLSRIVQVASLAHRRARIHFDDLQMRRDYSAGAAYGQSKLAMLMFGLELDRRLRASGSALQSVPAHPGMAVTQIFRRGDRAGLVQQLAGKLIFGIVGQSAAEGALPLLYAATASHARGGAYYGPDGAKEIKGPPADAEIRPQALDVAAAERLWRMSEDLTGVAYDFAALRR